MEKNFDTYYDILVEFGIATENEIALVTCINGNNEKTLCDILYARTGERDFEAYYEELTEEE